MKEKFTYFEPTKTHRISNPTLKAFQKNAVQSYFERQQQQQQHAHQARENGSSAGRPTSLSLGSPTGPQIGGYHQQISAPGNLESHIMNTKTVKMAESPSKNSIGLPSSPNYELPPPPPPRLKPTTPNGQMVSPVNAVRR
jgi:protein Shroom